MNKISVAKSVTKPRHSIVYHYRTNAKKRTKALESKPAKPTKPARQSVAKPKNIVVRPKVKTRVIKSTRSNVRAVSVKSTLLPKRATSRRSTKGTFDSRVKKIRSIRGVGEGKILVILAPGPSILEAKIEKLKGIEKIDTMTINKPDKRLWPSSYWMFCDRTQYTRNKNAFHKYQKTIINTDSIKAPHPKQVKIKNMPGHGFSVDMTKGFYIGRSTTFSAMQVAAWMDYEKIFIFGLDMCRVGKKLHSYGKNPDVPEKIRERRFQKESEFYDTAAKIMKKGLRNRYYICSSYNPWPFVDKFTRINQKVAVQYIIDCAKELS